MLANHLRLVSLVIIASGCSLGEPRLDCTSAETVRHSLEEMKKSLNEDEKKQLGEAMVEESRAAAMEFAETMANTMKVGQKPPSADEVKAKFNVASAVKHLHGKTAKEIITGSKKATWSRVPQVAPTPYSPLTPPVPPIASVPPPSSSSPQEHGIIFLPAPISPPPPAAP